MFLHVVMLTPVGFVIVSGGGKRNFAESLLQIPCSTLSVWVHPKGSKQMTKISILKVEKLKTTSVAAYPFWDCMGQPR